MQTKSAIKKLARRHVSIFWSTALIDGSKLEIALPTSPPSSIIAPHRERSSGSHPALAAVIIGPNSRNNFPPAASVVLVQSDLIYLSDFGNFSTLQEWTYPHSLDDATLPARQSRLQVSREAGVHKLIYLLQQKALNTTTAHVTSLDQARETVVPDEHPTTRVGSVWEDLSVSPTMVLGVVNPD